MSSKGISYKKNILLEYFHTFFRNINLTHGIWLIYLAAKGFSLKEIGILEGVFHITSLTMEVPTGVIADVFGRKFSRILGVISYLIYLVIMLLCNNIFLLIIAFIFCGLSYTFESGSGEALVYDSLKEMNKEDKFMRVNGNKEVIFQVASTIGLVFGGYIAYIKHEYVFLIMMVVFVFVGFIILLMKETEISKKEKEAKTSIKDLLYNHYVESCKTVMKNKRLRFLITIFGLIMAPVTVVFMYLQIYWTDSGYNELIITIFLALHALGGAIGGLFTGYLEKKFKEKKILLWTPLLELVCFLGLIFTKTSFIAIIILGVLDSILYIVLLEYTNKLVPSNQRASLLSFLGMSFSLIMIITFPLIGLIGDIYGLQIGFTILFLIELIIFSVYISLYRKNVL